MAREYVRIVQEGHALSTGQPVTKKIFNVFDFKRSSPSGSPSKSGIFSAYAAAIEAPMLAILSVSYISDAVAVRFLDDYTDPFTIFPHFGADGTLTGDSLPSVMAACVQLKTGVRGRSARGRKHFGPIAESSTTLDKLNSSNDTAWTTFLAALLAGFTTGGDTWKLHVVSQKFSVFTPFTATVVSNEVTSCSVNRALGTMKKRKQPT